MLRKVIDVIPFWWMEFSCISLLVILTLGAAYLSSRCFSIPNDKNQFDRSNTVLAILSGGFSVLLAFIIITTWNTLLRAQDSAAQEANAVAVMMRNVEILPEKPRVKITKALQDYAIAVRVKEWKSMKNGKESPDAAGAVTELYRAMQSFEPTTKIEQIYYQLALGNLNTIQKLRRDRINHLYSVIPERLSSALIVASISLALIMGGVRGWSSFADLIPIIIFAVVMGFNLAIAFAFDFPFSGDISVRNHFFYHGVLGAFKD
ncbi:hypothetical protein BN59_00855 [Legionella massiliensis]|uniref:DUF4239 domain-containing protein n=1 Tax=Legionella massiliensis TaxID=1034943 RepID=A0A078KU65_9GAMM|nr:DUF4239 domain-containing protein [Legionella massiliensis]CDZ76581.1 hypothetical protein BN59_00855 [Legionella massiliensis]CEE12319.1 hypothetical protein BN1094_00855 [Legionella massiliensis]